MENILVGAGKGKKSRSWETSQETVVEVQAGNIMVTCARVVALELVRTGKTWDIFWS